MKKNLYTQLLFLVIWGSALLYTPIVQGTQLSGTYQIDSNGIASTTIFKNLQSAITYLTSAGIRTDGGPSNVAPFGVSGPVNFIFAANSGPYQDRVEIPVITGASAANPIVINGNGNTLQALGDINNRAVILLQGATYLTIKNLTIKTLDITYGWGVQFKTSSNYNTIDSCTIDIGSVTSTTAANSAGIVFSNSATSVTTSGANGYFNIISNNTIKGNPTGAGMYYGIVGYPAAAGTTISANKLINNLILNTYAYGIYWANSNSTLIRRNTITRTTKTSFTTSYGIYLTGTSRRDTIDANEITGMFNGSPTTTSAFYGIYLSSYTGLSTEPNTFMNNIIYNNKGNGTSNGIYSATSYNNRYYNNTISIDNAAATSTTATLQGVYFSGTASATSTFDFRNNIINISQAGTGQKNAMFIASAQTAGITLDKNAYYGEGTTYACANYNGNNYNTFAAWKTFVGVYDQNSVDYAPTFTNLVLGDLRPKDVWYSLSGDIIPIVTTYYSGLPRITPPMGVGAFTSNILATDVAANEITKPTPPYAAGSQLIGIKIRNIGSTTITSATINWTINGIAQTAGIYTGSIAPGAISSNIPLSSISIASNTLYTINAEIVNPNGLVDSSATNNTISDITAANIPGGTYTVNSATPTGGSNFASLGAFANIANIGGVAGPIIMNFTPSSGPYTEQVFFNSIPGLSLANNIVINGNDQYIQFNNTANSLGVINLINADHFTFNHLNVKTLNASYGIGYLLTLGSDSNTIDHCIIDISSVTGSSLSAGIAVTGSLISPTTANALCNYNKITNNTILGGPTGGAYYGISLNVNSTTNSPNNGYVVANNIIKDVTVYGIYSSAVLGSRFSNNQISRPLKSSPTTFYGMYFASNLTGDTIENNIISQPAGSNTLTTASCYGIYLTGINAQVARPNLIRNNIISDFKTTGIIYGIYCSTVGYTSFLHNTVSIDDPINTSTSTAYAFYSTGTPTSQINRNNIYHINRGGSGNKALIYLNTVSATGYVISNNDYSILSPAGSSANYLGYYNALFKNNLTDWYAAVTFDANSVSANPSFRYFVTNHPLTPSNDTLNGTGFNTFSQVPVDFRGNTRTTPPDIGAYEFYVPTNDVGITKIVAPTISQVTFGNMVNIEVQLKNFGKSLLTSADLNWKIDTALQTPSTWYGSIPTSDTTNFTVGSYFVGSTGIFPVKIWASNPNLSPDSIPENDTISMILCTPLSGTVTLNPSLPSSSTNFTSFASFAKVLTTCGISGSLTLVMSPGIYNEQISFIGKILGANAANKVIIDGGDSALTIVKHDGSIQRATLLLSNVSDIEFRNIRFETTNSSAGTAVQLINNADSNTFTRCTFISPYTTSTAVNTFVSSGSLVSATTQGNGGNYLLIDSCISVGGYYNIDLYGNSTQKPIGNIVRNSVIRDAYFYGIYAIYQDGVRILNNKVLNTGIIGNNSGTTIAGISVQNSNSGNQILNNEVQNMLGGRGIQVLTNIGTSTFRIVVANNIVNIGDALFTTYGIYENNNAFLDIAYNTIKLNTAEPNYVGAALYTSNTDPVTYNNIRIVNNIFTAPNGALSVYIVNGLNLVPASYMLDNNVYFSTSSYPFRVVNFITNTLVSFVTGTPNMLGTFLPGNNVHGQFFMPTFFSSTNLRSIAPELDDSGMVVSSVPIDIDGKTRSFSTPDIGVNEFSKPGADAGVVQILSPVKPMANGLNNIVVVVKNFGSNPLISYNVHYKIDTVIQTITRFGSLAPSAIDTIVFDSISGVASTSQQYNFSGDLVSIISWTSNPNGVTDSLNNNDTSFTSICGSLNGTYTIDAAGSGPSNFPSIQMAINKLECGGISGPVVFNMAPGVYNNQVTIPTVVGANSTNTITFKSATGIASSVTITTNTGSASNNYVIRLLGARFIHFENLTFTNTDPTYSRIISINKEATTNVNTSELVVRGCSFTGNTFASTLDQYALIWGPMGDNATNLTFTGNSFTNGSIGIWIGGQNIVNQNAPGLIIDTNTFTNQYYASMWIQNRFDTKIRGNNILGHPTYTGYYGMYINGFGQASEISRNNVVNPAGSYGIYIGQNAYYDAAGLTDVTNNLVLMQGTSTQYGLYLTTSNKVRYYNNTVRLNTTSTGSYAFYFSGHASFVNGSTTYPASYNVSLVNNILSGVNGYALYTTNVQANMGLSDIDHNLYYTTSATPLYLSAISYTPAQFHTNYRNALYLGSDAHSLFGDIAFSSPTSFIPLNTSPSAWLSNGRGRHLALITKDYQGNSRSFEPVTGVPDIGAYEIAPTSMPVSGTFTDSIGYGITQYFMEKTDTLAAVTWGFSGTLPTSIDGKFFPGSLVSDPATYAVPSGKTAMDMFVRITATGGAFYAYDLKIYYKASMLGTVPFESDIIMAAKTAGVWSNYPFGLTVIDTLAKTFYVGTLTEFSDFTGTDLNNALPVTLLAFDAKKIGTAALLNWTTGSEMNLSSFIVERSIDNVRYSAIGKVNPTGSASLRASYRYEDLNVQQITKSSRVYYRLKSLDNDGSFKYSNVRLVEFDKTTIVNQTLVFPNPFETNVNIAVSSNMDGEAIVSVFDILGKEVFTNSFAITKGINTLTTSGLQALSSGIYFVKISGPSIEQETIKLIKE
jgi:trimeric autotransporter adhesin